MSKKPREHTLIREMRKNTENYLLLVPYSVFFIVFTIIPILVSVYLSFTYFNLLQPPEFRGLFNYIRLFLDDEIFLISLRNTMIFAVITGPISYFLCILFAWLINELGPKMRNVMTLIFYAPSISGSLYVIWSYIFSGDSYHGDRQYFQYDVAVGRTDNTFSRGTPVGSPCAKGGGGR